jgi:branched-chain amino acid transport system substrate-binding protein
MSMQDKRSDELALSKLKASFATSMWQPRNALFFGSIFKSDSTLGEKNLRYADAGLEYTQANGSVEISRNIASFLIKNLLPLALILAVLYASHFVPGDQLSVRVSMGITGLLTAMVLYQRLSADLPSIGYLVLMDYGFFAVFGLAIAHVTLSVATYVAGKAKLVRVERVASIAELSLIPVTLIAAFIVVSRY